MEWLNFVSAYLNRKLENCAKFLYWDIYLIFRLYLCLFWVKYNANVCISYSLDYGRIVMFELPFAGKEMRNFFYIYIL